MSGDTSLRDAIAHAADPVAVMQRVVDQALDLIEGADGASLEVRREGAVLEYLCASGTLAPHVGLRLPIATSMSGLALRTDSIQRCDDSETDDRVDRAATRRTGVASMLCVPLRIGGEVLAVLKVSSRRTYAFHHEDARTLERLTAFLGTAMTLSSELAEVTSRLLDELPVDAGDIAARDTARFVANVMTPGLVADVESRALVAGLLEGDALSIVVQPVSSLLTGDVRRVEALARFDVEPRRGPDLWFADAWRAGLGADLELLAVERALDALELLPADVRMSINVSPRVALDDRLCEALSARGAARVTLEVTEHDAVDDYDAVVAGLDRLRALGVHVAVDDAGSGYASLSHILRLRPDVLKIDRVITTGVDADPVRQAVAASLVRLGGSMGALVVAEGIETEREARALVDLGVTHGQGWLLGRPVPAAELDLSTRWHV